MTAEPNYYHYMTDEAKDAIAWEILAHNGREVFFMGKMHEGRIVNVAARAFGNKHSVPAILSFLRPGDQILHNHPSGYLEPSDGDIIMASLAAEWGVGTYIINNDCTRVELIVPAFEKIQKACILSDFRIVNMAKKQSHQLKMEGCWF